MNKEGTFEWKKESFGLQMSFVFLGLSMCDQRHIYKKLQTVPSLPFTYTLNRPEKSI